MGSTPGKFLFKIKSYDNEEGEYSPWQLAEPGTIIQFILNHWFNETLPNNLDIIVIKNDKGHQLAIDHENKDVFRFFLIPADTEFSYFYKMTDIRFMFFILEHFFSGLLDVVRENMNSTTDDWRWVKGDFLEKDFHFAITPASTFKHLIGGVSILVAAFALTLLLAFGVLDGFAVAFFLVFIVIFGLWSFLTKWGWYQDQKHLAITLSRGDRYIHVSHRGHSVKIPKADIISIQQHFVSDEDYWEPVFTQIDFQNGDTLNITDWLIPQKLIKDKFAQEAHIYLELKSGKKRLQKPTHLFGYIPESLKKRYQR